MNKKFLAFILFSLSVSLFSMQPDGKNADQEKARSRAKLTQDQVVFWYLDHLEPLLIKDIKLQIINLLRELYFLDAMDTLKNKKCEQARELFLSIKLNSRRMSPILYSRPIDAEEIKRFFNDEIITLFKEAAQLDPSLDEGLAEYNYGIIYDVGLGVKKDYKEAAHWFKLSAEHGNAVAQFRLSIMYMEGEGVKEDHKEAVLQLRLSAKGGYDAAQLRLGHFYEDGYLVEQNSKKAIRFLSLAAEQGNARAQKSLGYIYEKGKIIEQSYQKAAYWYRLSANQGDFGAKEALERIARKI
jgi:hypothetical protein